MKRSVVAGRSFRVQPLVQALEQGDRLVEPECLSLPASRSLAESLSLTGIVEQARNLVRESGVVAWRDQHGVAAVLDDRRNAAHAARHDRLAGSHPLEHREWHTFEARGADEDIHRRE